MRIIWLCLADDFRRPLFPLAPGLRSRSTRRRQPLQVGDATETPYRDVGLPWSEGILPVGGSFDPCS
jgi:hypothetical protein